MFYTVYKITNTVNGKTYIGKHQTQDLNDGYMGSGKLLKKAIRKYGLDKFTKEILHVFQTEEEMNLKEKELVVVSEETYNLCDGGRGGFGYINKNGLNPTDHLNNGSIKHIERCRKAAFTTWERNPGLRKILADAVVRNRCDWTGKKHTKETKAKMRLSHKGKQCGSKNSQFGKMWITNGIENNKIRKEDVIPQGWYKGRIQNFI